MKRVVTFVCARLNSMWQDNLVSNSIHSRSCKQKGKPFEIPGEKCRDIFLASVLGERALNKNCKERERT